MSLARTHSIALVGVEGHPVEIEADIENGLVGLLLVGLPDTALREARDRIRSAIVNSQEKWPNRRITVGLSPASLPKRGSSFDVGIAVAILTADGVIPPARVMDLMFLGELGLDGRLRPVRGVLPAVAAAAAYQVALANLNQARVNLRRTEIRSPVNGYVTNLLAQLGDYANVGENLISLVDADSYWVDGYFEETKLPRIKVGDPARVYLIGESSVIDGHVESIAGGIADRERQGSEDLLANVNPTFSWVRLAQRVPVRIALDHVPPNVRLVTGRTATVVVEPSQTAH